MWFLLTGDEEIGNPSSRRHIEAVSEDVLVDRVPERTALTMGLLAAIS